MNTVRILGSRAREQVPGTGITLLAPGFRGALTQLTPGVAASEGRDLPFAEAAAGADAMLAAQLNLHLEAHQHPRAPGLRSRSAMVTHPRVIVPRRGGVTYALLQTDETGVSSFVAAQPGNDTEAVFLLSVSGREPTRRTLRVLMWPDLQVAGPGCLAVATRWERLRRPHQLAHRGPAGTWQSPDWHSLARGAVLLLLHDTFSTPQATFADWLEHDSFAAVAQRYEHRCLAFAHPTLAAGIDDNLERLLSVLAPLPGPFDVVAHGRGGLLARALAIDDRLPLRRVCQVGTPNNGTPLANESRLPQFLDGHVAMLATVSKSVARGTLEGVLCLARCVAQGLRTALPGVEVLAPGSAPPPGLAGFGAASLEWYTVGGEFRIPETLSRDVFDAGEFANVPNDLVAPSQGCHDPGIPVTDSLHVTQLHHHQYFADARVRETLASWLV